MKKRYTFKGYCLELDSKEIVPNDPGAGTPALVWGPGKAGAATFWCATSIGCLGDGTVIPDAVMEWLDKMSDTVDNFLADNGG